GLRIRMKLLGRSYARFCCLIIGEEGAALRRHTADRKPHRLKKAAIKAINERLARFSVPKRGPYWDRKNKRFKEPPNVKVMAQQGSSLNVYYNEFRYSSLHVHSSTRIFTHVEMQGGDPRKLMFEIEAAKDAEV